MSNPRAEHIQAALPADCKLSARQMRELVRMMESRGVGAAVPVLDIVDCGAPHPFGLCPACGRGHGAVVYRRGANTTEQARAGSASPGSAGSECPVCGGSGRDRNPTFRDASHDLYTVQCARCDGKGSIPNAPNQARDARAGKDA